MGSDEGPLAGCATAIRANLHAEQIWPRQRIPARARIDLVMPITLASEAADCCQGVTFPLRYRTRVNVLGAGG